MRLERQVTRTQCDKCYGSSANNVFQKGERASCEFLFRVMVVGLSLKGKQEFASEKSMKRVLKPGERPGVTY